MATRYFGERIKRNEDPRLLTGQGLYVDDVDLPNMLHAAFLRSPYAHARINNIDVSPALQREGVVAIYTANDLGDYWKPGPLLVSPPPVKDIVFNEANAGSAGEGQGQVCGRAGCDGDRGESLHRRGRACRYSSGLRTFRSCS